MMINTFKPYFKIIKRFKLTKIHDWFYFSIFAYNYIGLTFTIYGYGFQIGVKIFKVGEDETI